MIAVLNGLTVIYPEKLDSRRDEVLEFGLWLYQHFKPKRAEDPVVAKVWQNKRHDLMGKIVKPKGGVTIESHRI